MTRAQLIQGDARAIPLATGSVHCVVTSPPYWGARRYHGDDGMIGLEASLDAHLEALVAVFGEVWRVLRDDGTLWLNYGDVYSSGGRKTSAPDHLQARAINEHRASENRRPMPAGLKPKDLIGLPWRLAFALQADGWTLRTDIVWAKPNPIPESVTDRPTRSHEFLFLLSKGARYAYDADAVREPYAVNTLRPTSGHGRPRRAPEASGDSGLSRWHARRPPAYFYDADAIREPHKSESLRRYESGFTSRDSGDPLVEERRGALFDTERMGDHVNPLGANKRDVWTIPTQKYKSAHHATFPEALVEPCIKAGTSERGVCAACGAPWRRVTDKDYVNPLNTSSNGPRSLARRGETPGFKNRLNAVRTTRGWEPTCACGAPVVPATVLDPFAGSGTTCAVAQKLGRRGIGLELNRSYLTLARERLALAQAPLPLA